MITRWIFALTFMCLCSLQAIAQSVTLGVLEDVPPVYAGETDKPAVRVVFHFDGQKWTSFPSNCPDQECLQRITSQYPTLTRWSIGFNGREIAKLTSRAPKRFDFYAHVGLENLEQPSRVPWIGSKSEEFGGFTGEAVYRPLVANSKPFFSDPDQWNEVSVPGNIQIALRSAFRRENPTLCKRDQSDETKSMPFDYADMQVQTTKALKSRAGVWIAELHLENASACDEVVKFGDPWFLVKADGSTDYIGEGMQFVSAGDFNNDGRSEILFSIADYNRGGYELFYDQFAKHISFKFNFH